MPLNYLGESGELIVFCALSLRGIAKHTGSKQALTTDDDKMKNPIFKTKKHIIKTLGDESMTHTHTNNMAIKCILHIHI